MQLAWPGLAPWHQGFGAFTEGARRITYPDGEIPREGPAPVRRPAAIHRDERRPGPAH